MLANLGSPDAPTATAVRRYLREFLSDRRVVDLPRPLWWLILNGFILPLRPFRSAAAYKKIWTAEGSPLVAISRRQADALREPLAADKIKVALGMRYGKPAITAALSELRAAGCERLVILPAYPQYSAATTAAIFDAVTAVIAKERLVPEVRTINGYHAHPRYIEALATSVREFWQKNGEAQHLLMSFHGLPADALTKGDPYASQCQETGRLLSEALELPPRRFTIAFQSRFGRQEWQKPYTDIMLAELARSAHKRVDVICPGFAADCLETLEEIAIRGREIFLEEGGNELRYIPALNDRDDHIAFLTKLVCDTAGNWLNS